jgi:hypothetical protein
MLLFLSLAAAVLGGDPPAARPVNAPGLNNLFELATRVYSGGAPEGDAGFASLQNLGVKTIISVDGSKPEVELAEKHGLRYIHIPIGYDGASRSNEWQLIRAAQLAEGPIYVHCHHGKHRGPAAAAIICEGTEGWSTNQAVQWLNLAGTSPEYPGLFQNAARFEPPTPEQLASVATLFPSRVESSALVDEMVAIDTTWDRLKLIQKAGYRTPPAQPDVEPANEATLLVEGFREAQRTEEAKKRGEKFLGQLKSAEDAAGELRAALKQTPPAPAMEINKNWDRVNQACATCHKENRNRIQSPR